MFTGLSRNTRTTAYSSILGGSGNNDNGCTYAGMFGFNLGAVANNTFHVNCLNACDTLIYTGGPLPRGSIFVCAGTYTGPYTVYPLSILL